MCEPAHSITQYPDHDDDGNPMGPRLEALAQKEGFVKKWFRKIGGFFNLSRCGRGHSESVMEVSPVTMNLWLPEHAKFEGLWWERTVVHDGGRRYRDFRDEEALKSAKVYSDSVCLGSMSIFRRFLETSLDRSDRPQNYVARLLEGCLNKEGCHKLAAKIKSVFKCDTSGLFRSAGEKQKESAIKIVMGFTRKRELWLPHWADEDKLWLPGQ